jgi:hypothetical protein
MAVAQVAAAAAVIAGFVGCGGGAAGPSVRATPLRACAGSLVHVTFAGAAADSLQVETSPATIPPLSGAVTAASADVRLTATTTFTLRGRTGTSQTTVRVIAPGEPQHVGGFGGCLTDRAGGFVWQAREHFGLPDYDPALRVISATNPSSMFASVAPPGGAFIDLSAFDAAPLAHVPLAGDWLVRRGLNLEEVERCQTDAGALGATDVVVLLSCE